MVRHRDSAGSSKNTWPAGALAAMLLRVPLIVFAFVAHVAYDGGADIPRGLALTGFALVALDDLRAPERPDVHQPFVAGAGVRGAGWRGPISAPRTRSAIVPRARTSPRWSPATTCRRFATTRRTRRAVRCI